MKYLSLISVCCNNKTKNNKTHRERQRQADRQEGTYTSQFTRMKFVTTRED